MTRSTIRSTIGSAPGRTRMRMPQVRPRPSMTAPQVASPRMFRWPIRWWGALPSQSPGRRWSRPLMIGGAVVLIAAAGAALTSPTARRTARRLMMRMAEHRQETFAHPETLDELTGLANRPEAMRLLTEALGQAQAQGSRVGALYVDIDHFAECVEAYGAAAGDHVLQVSAARLQAQLRSGDVVCRIGADDLLVIMQAAPPNHVVARIGERIAEALAQPITYDGETILVTASMGIAVAKEGVTEPDELVSQAADALDRARASGTHVLQY